MKTSTQDSLNKIEKLLQSAKSIAIDYTQSELYIGERRIILKKYKTIAGYAKKYEKEEEEIIKWIDSGKVPVNDFVVIPELDYLTLIKDKRYNL